MFVFAILVTLFSFVGCDNPATSPIVMSVEITDFPVQVWTEFATIEVTITYDRGAPVVENRQVKPTGTAFPYTNYSITVSEDGVLSDPVNITFEDYRMINVLANEWWVFNSYGIHLNDDGTFVDTSSGAGFWTTNKLNNTIDISYDAFTDKISIATNEYARVTL